MLAAILLIAAAFDLTRPPRDQRLAHLALTGIHAYQATLSEWMPALGVQCRFVPSCSHFAATVIERQGLVMGSWRTMRRIVRCGPWTPQGTVDPP